MTHTLSASGETPSAVIPVLITGMTTRELPTEAIDFAGRLSAASVPHSGGWFQSRRDQGSRRFGSREKSQKSRGSHRVG